MQDEKISFFLVTMKEKDKKLWKDIEIKDGCNFKWDREDSR